MMHWALTAAAVLALVFVIRSLFLSGRNRNAGREKLGFGFSIGAAALWVYVLEHHLGELGPALRLAGGVLLLLPVVSALAYPARARIGRAVGCLILAVLLAGSTVQGLWIEYGPDTRPENIRKIEAQLEEAHDMRTRLLERQSALKNLSAVTKTEVLALGRDWSVVENDPEALKKIELLANARDRLTRITAELAELEISSAKLSERLVSSAVSSTSDAAETELQAITLELESRTQPTDEGLVEQHLRTQKLRKLFEAEQGSN